MFAGKPLLSLALFVYKSEIPDEIANKIFSKLHTARFCWFS